MGQRNSKAHKQISKAKPKKIHCYQTLNISQTLKTLEHDGFILRTVYPVVPPKVEYQLTILGSQAAEKTMYLIGWIEKSLPEILEGTTLPF